MDCRAWPPTDSRPFGGLRSAKPPSLGQSAMNDLFADRRPELYNDHVDLPETLL